MTIDNIIQFLNHQHFVLLWNEMQSSPSSIYSQSIDKQRIVVVGRSCSRIVEMVMHVLTMHNRKFDYSTPSKEKISNASVLLIQPAADSTNLLEYNHHMLVISQLSPNDKSTYLNLSNATPKGGTIIYDDSDPLVREIAKAERPDVSVSPFDLPKYELTNGKATLVSSTNEKFHTQLISTDDLKNASAAKELLKKIGISSGQFYKAIASF